MIRNAKTFLVALAFLGTASYAGASYAAETRANATLCQVISSPRNIDFDGGTFEVSTGSGSDVLLCPFIDVDPLTHESVTDLGVHVVDNNPQNVVTVQACTVSYVGGSASCGAPESTSNAGYARLEPSLSSWSSASGTAYIHITMPRHSGTASQYRGYFASDS